MKCLGACILLLVAALLRHLCALPVGNPDAALEAMAQIPQWHCMRYRKFELIRRCRGYKNGVRKN